MVTGFLFEQSTVESYEEALQRAFYVFAKPDLLNAMRCRAMTQPFNWSQAVEPYAELYEDLVRRSVSASEKH
jgi:starch synthase